MDLRSPFRETSLTGSSLAASLLQNLHEILDPPFFESLAGLLVVIYSWETHAEVSSQIRPPLLVSFPYPPTTCRTGCNDTCTLQSRIPQMSYPPRDDLEQKKQPREGEPKEGIELRALDRSGNEQSSLITQIRPVYHAQGRLGRRERCFL